MEQVLAHRWALAAASWFQLCGLHVQTTTSKYARTSPSVCVYQIKHKSIERCYHLQHVARRRLDTSSQGIMLVHNLSLVRRRHQDCRWTNTQKRDLVNMNFVCESVWIHWMLVMILCMHNISKHSRSFRDGFQRERERKKKVNSLCIKNKQMHAWKTILSW